MSDKLKFVGHFTETLSLPYSQPMKNRSRRLRVWLWLSGVALLFVLYTSGLSHNPPGFYLDESGIAYNAYLVAHTGAGEFGPRFPLYFELLHAQCPGGTHFPRVSAPTLTSV
jgi:hypothetical protein